MNFSVKISNAIKHIASPKKILKIDSAPSLTANSEKIKSAHTKCSKFPMCRSFDKVNGNFNVIFL